MYVTTISIPIVFDAFDDAEARARLEELLTHFALDGVTLGALRDKFSAEVSDAPTADGLEEALPYEPLRTVEIGSKYRPQLDTDCNDENEPERVTVCTHPANSHMVMPPDWTAGPRFTCSAIIGREPGSGRAITCRCTTDHYRS